MKNPVYTGYHMYLDFGSGILVAYGQRGWPSNCVWIVPGTLNPED